MRYTDCRDQGLAPPARVYSDSDRNAVFARKIKQIEDDFAEIEGSLRPIAGEGDAPKTSTQRSAEHRLRARELSDWDYIAAAWQEFKAGVGYIATIPEIHGESDPPRWFVTELGYAIGGEINIGRTCERLQRTNERTIASWPATHDTDDDPPHVTYPKDFYSRLSRRAR